MKPPHPSLETTTAGRIADLDDRTLRRAHPLLDPENTAVFGQWIDCELERLEWQFRENIIPRTLRKSLGR